MRKIAMTSHRLSCLSGEPGMLERTGLIEGDTSAEALVVAYHERTKHDFHRYAAAGGLAGVGGLAGDRGRDGCRQPPPAQIRTRSTTSYGSSVRSNDHASGATSRGRRAAPSDVVSGSVSGTSATIRQHFPSVTSFPRQTPLPAFRFCSLVSPVLRGHLTSHQRSCQPYPR